MSADLRGGPGLDLALATGLIDDAAVFPPGLATLTDALARHRGYRGSALAAMVGPLVLPGTAAGPLGALLGQDSEALTVCLTFPAGPAAMEAALAALPAQVAVAAVEVAVPPGDVVAGLVSRINTALGRREAEVFVEIPRDERAEAVLSEVAAGGVRAKLRTGGTRQELYPTEEELASTLLAVRAAGVGFKATAGLHRAVRNTDPETRFEQHGFLNVLLATVAADAGASHGELVTLLAERVPESVAARVRELGAAGVTRGRAMFTSFGSCSVTDPLSDLTELGLLGLNESEES